MSAEAKVYKAMLAEGHEPGTAIALADLAMYLVQNRPMHPLIEQRWRKVRVLGKKGNVRILKDLNSEDNGVSWILAGEVFRGDMEIVFIKGESRYRLTEEGKKNAERLMATLPTSTGATDAP